MSSTGSKWLVGCGIGCGVIILIVIIVIGVGYVLIRDTVDEFKEAETSNEVLVETYGEIEDYTPAMNGRIPADRIEAFLTVRDSLQWLREEMVNSIHNITEDIEEVQDSEKPFWRVLGIIRKGFGAIPQMAEYYTSRNYALLNNQLGLGEYYYLYTIIYYAWLERSPGDGPDFRIMGDNENYQGFRWEESEDEESDWERSKDDVREERRYRITRKVRKWVLPMMRNQMEMIEDAPRSQYTQTWRIALENEIEAMRDDRERLPWQDGLPEIMESSLRHYRDRLLTSYDETLNPLELPPDQD